MDGALNREHHILVLGDVLGRHDEGIHTDGQRFVASVSVEDRVLIGSQKSALRRRVDRVVILEHGKELLEELPSQNDVARLRARLLKVLNLEEAVSHTARNRNVLGEGGQRNTNVEIVGRIRKVEPEGEIAERNVRITRLT